MVNSGSAIRQGETVFCDFCGMQFLPRQSICSHCGSPPTRHWLQLVSLVTLTIAIACNSLVALFLLPRLITGEQPPRLFLAWLWFDEKLSLYGWAAAAAALLVWAYWPRYGYEPEKEMRIARGLLIVLLVAGFISLLLPWIPVATAASVRTAVESHPGLTLTSAWGVVILAVGVLCLNGETRERLLGDGRVLSLVALGLLFLVLSLILLGWWVV